MATNINWKVSTLERNVSDGGVFNVHWRVEASETVDDKTYAASSYGTKGLTPDPESDSFIAYDDLTEETVVAWVKAAMGAEQVTAYEQSLTSQIEKQKNPPTATGLPW